MNNFSIKLAAALTVLSTPMISSVIAEEKQGFYTTLSTGISYPKNDSENELLPVINSLQLNLSGLADEFDPFKIENDSGLKLEGGIGYDFGKSRIEVTYDQSKSKMNSMDFSNLGVPPEFATIEINGGKRTTKSIMVSGFYDFDTNSKFTPYIGGGLGVAFIDTDPWTFQGAGESETQVSVAPFEFPSTEQQLFSWQLQAGVAYEINEQVDLTADLTYKDTSDFNIGIMSVQPSALISVEAGLRYYF